ncbi:MAG: hypothetical protein OEV08_00900 [Nitrospira sp.]|nr:hypothetical protein [Nitrospira sp.]
MKVCVAVPNGGTVKSRLMTDIVAALFSAHGQIGFMWAETEGTLGPHNRWLAAQQAVATGCDYLWLVDNDMSFPPTALPQLIAANKELIGAAYNYRKLPRQTVVKVLDADGNVVFADASTFPNEPFRCHAIGSGCKLVKVSALQRIPQPWFALAWDATGALSKTDDVWFCEQAASVGIETWCHPGIGCTHIGDFLY